MRREGVRTNPLVVHVSFHVFPLLCCAWTKGCVWWTLRHCLWHMDGIFSASLITCSPVPTVVTPWPQFLSVHIRERGDFYGSNDGCTVGCDSSNKSLCTIGIRWHSPTYEIASQGHCVACLVIKWYFLVRSKVEKWTPVRQTEEGLSEPNT